MPAMTWNQRKTAWRVEERSGNIVQAPLLVEAQVLTERGFGERKGS
jgi:hypothetical protein